MNIHISDAQDEPGSNPLLPVRDRIDETLRSHPAVTLASEEVPLMYRGGDRFGPVRLVERGSDVAVVFAADTTRWVVVVQPGEDSPQASLLLGAPNPGVRLGRRYRASHLNLSLIHI